MKYVVEILLTIRKWCRMTRDFVGQVTFWGVCRLKKMLLSAKWCCMRREMIEKVEYSAGKWQSGAELVGLDE